MPAWSYNFSLVTLVYIVTQCCLLWASVVLGQKIIDSQYHVGELKISRHGKSVAAVFYRLFSS
jgi:hypothetical protein